MYKDGFELKEGKYYWARDKFRGVLIVLVTEYYSNFVFLFCGDDFKYDVDDLTLLAEILPPA